MIEALSITNRRGLLFFKAMKLLRRSVEKILHGHRGFLKGSEGHEDTFDIKFQ